MDDRLLWLTLSVAQLVLGHSFSILKILQVLKEEIL